MNRRCDRRSWIRRFVLAVLGGLAPGLALSATLAARESRLVEVTVYPDRAEVVREARVEVPAGPSVVEFGNIPFAVEPDSVRVSAKGVSAVLGAVEIRARAEEPKETAEQVALAAEVKRIERDMATLGSQDRTATELREFLKSLRATTATRESENLGAGRADPGSIQGVYDLLATRMQELGDREIERRTAGEKLAKELEVARAKLAASRPAGSIRSRVAGVEIEAAQAGALTLRLAYLVAAASWRPSYRATLDAATGEVALVSEAVVRQTTGEDWSGVVLRLSTASPARGVAPPEMTSVFLRAGFVAVVGGVAASDKDSAAARAYQNTLVMAPDAIEEDTVSSKRQTEIVHSAYNVAFEVPGRSEVPADGADHRVVLRQETLPGMLVYRTAPALEPAAYLTAVVRAPAQYPLLAGPLRALAGGAYLGTYGLPETAPGAELTVPFGVDNRVKVQRVRQPQERGTEGITGKTREIVYEFRTSLENLRDEKVTITVEDRIPVSEDDQIVVELEKRTTPGHRESKHRPGVLLWSVELGRKEKKELTLAYTVRFPKDLVVPGLD